MENSELSHANPVILEQKRINEIAFVCRKARKTNGYYKGFIFNA